MTLLAMYVFIAVIPYWNQLKICIADCHISIVIAGENCKTDADSHDEEDLNTSDDCNDFLLPAPPDRHIATSEEKDVTKTKYVQKSFENMQPPIFNSVTLKENHLRPIPYLTWYPPLNQISVYRL